MKLDTVEAMVNNQKYFRMTENLFDEFHTEQEYFTFKDLLESANKIGIKKGELQQLVALLLALGHLKRRVWHHQIQYTIVA